MTLSLNHSTPAFLWGLEESSATIEEWLAIPRVPGYRFVDGWWHDSSGGRSNTPPVPMTERQLKILAGIIPIES